MSIVQKVCPLCGGAGRWDDIECQLCDTRGYLDLVDEDDALSLPSSGRAAGGPDAARPVGAGRGNDPRPAPTENDLQAEWLRGYATGRTERRLDANAAGYATGVAHVAALHLEQRGRRAALVATLLAFGAGVAAAPTIVALLAEATS